MQFSFTEEQEIIRDAAARLVAGLAPSEQSRSRAADTEWEYNQALWAALVQSGYHGMLVPSQYGGSDLGFVEAGCVLEMLGGGLASGPYLSSAVVAIEWLRRFGTDSHVRQLLPEIAKGSMIACPLVQNGYCGAVVTGEGNELFVNGNFAPIPYGHISDILLLEARDERNGSNGAPLAMVIGAREPGINAKTIFSIDPTRRFAAIELKDVRITGSNILELYSEQSGHEWIWSVGAAATAAEMLGGASKALLSSRDYAVGRTQFGSAIGSFQSIKHMLADQAVSLEGMRSAVYAALWALDNDESVATTSASLAKWAANETYARIATESVQIHGAFGFTEEAAPHQYLKRARADSMLYGTTSEHLDFLADHLDDLA